MKLGAINFDPSIDLKKLNEKGHERNSFLLPHQIERLVQATQQTKAKFYLPSIIYLGAEHGSSKQEILDLRWSDIDFDYDVKGLIRFFRTKNGKERTDYIMPRSKEALLKWHDHQKWMRHRKKITQVQTDLVFGHLDGSPRKRFDKAWWKSLEIAGINNIHFQDLRHTFCSNLILAGVGLKEVSEMIGHKDITMTNRYAHITTGHRASMQGLLSEHYKKQSGEHIGNIKP